MDPIERLTAIFEKFPGIGPRQAGRFVQYLLRTSTGSRRDLADAVLMLSGTVRQCTSCMRFYGSDERVDKLCSICANPNRDKSLLAVVASDTDLLALERSGTYRGQYFVLGGTISLASEKHMGLRDTQLIASLEARINAGLTEVILAFPANPEGDYTALHVRDELKETEPTFKISTLGRGLSTGSELEYADPETLKSALENRK